MNEAFQSTRLFINKTKRLIDTIASNNGYRRNLPYANLFTHLLSYPKSRDAIASKNIFSVHVHVRTE